MGISVLLAFSYCASKPAKLKLTKTPFMGKELRTNGYYYSFDKNEGQVFVNIFTLYQNGVFVFMGSPYSKSLEASDLYMSEIARKKEYVGQKKAHGWGVFLIDKERITIEQWLDYNPSLVIPSFISEGTIINDSTINIAINGQRTWKFRYFSPKPDSTNSFIK